MIALAAPEFDAESKSPNCACADDAMQTHNKTNNIFFMFFPFSFILCENGQDASCFLQLEKYQFLLYNATKKRTKEGFFMIKVILWDWDNTLVDTFEAIWHAQNDMRVHFGLGEWTQEEAKKAMNLSGRNLIKNLVGEEKAKEARAFYLKRYAQNACHLKLKDGATDLLNSAKAAGYINILASNKAKDILENEVETLGILDKFDRIIGAEEAAEDKPSKIFTDKAIEGLGPVDLLVSVGDGLSDVKMAHNYPIGIAVLAFTDAASAEFESEKPDYYAKDLFVCKNILLSLPEK